MQAGKRMFAVVSAALIAAAGSCAATQMLAARFDHQPALGGRITIAGQPTYPPLAILAWSERWSETYPHAFAVPKLIFFLAMMGSAFVLILGLRPMRSDQRPFGRKAWGGAADADEAGLLAESGAVIGKLKRDILVYDGPHHLLLTGGTRSGKTRGCVVPTILTSPHSLVVLDLKGELYGGDPRVGFPGTSGWRRQLGPVYRFAPTETESDRLNLIDTIRPGAQEVRDVQNLVELIADPYGDGRFQEFWDRAAKQILVGLILHVAYAEPPDRKTLARVFELLARFDDTVKLMAATLHRHNQTSGQPETHPEVRRAAHSYAAYHDKLRAGIKATAESYLGIFADPLVRENTTTSTFRISDLMCGAHPATLYLCWPPNDSRRVKPILRNVFGALLRQLMEDQSRAADGRPKKQRLVLVLDEFPQLGKLDIYEQGMSAMAGYGVTATMITQSLHQVTQSYGRNHTILDNSHIVISFAATDVETAETISKLAGDIYEMRPQETWSGKRALLGLDHRAITYREERRPLLLPSEVRRLPDSEELIFVTGAKPLRAKKLRYDEEPIFRERLFPTPAFIARPALPSPWADMRSLGLVGKSKPRVEAGAEPDADKAQRARPAAPATARRTPAKSKPRTPKPQPDLLALIEGQSGDAGVGADQPDNASLPAPPAPPASERPGFDLRPRGGGGDAEAGS
jgi:type IV secretion system protein VirD4